MEPKRLEGMTDRSEASRNAADKNADDAILLDVIVSPEKEAGVAGNSVGAVTPSAEGNTAGETGGGCIPQQVPAVAGQSCGGEPASAPEPSVPEVASNSEPEAFRRRELHSDTDMQTPAQEEKPAASDSGELSDSGEAGVKQEDRVPLAGEGEEAVFEGDASPWEPSGPRFIDPEAGADEIPPLEAGQGTGGTLPPSSGKAEDNDEKDEKPMTLLEHLGELRSRLVRSFLAITVAFFVCYAFAKDLFYYLSLPLLQVMPADAKFIYTGVAEGFFVDLKVSFVAAVFVACPFLFYQIWAFIAPGLYEEEKRYVAPLSFCSAFFFLGGATFCYFVVFPFAFKFFMSYSTDNIVAMLSINEYLGFALKMLIAFGLIFEMPLFSFFLSRMGIVTAARMRSVRKYAVLAVFIIAAILTPPDVFSQIMMAIPMLILYEISIVVAAVFGKRTKPAKSEQKEEQEEGESA